MVQAPLYHTASHSARSICESAQAFQRPSVAASSARIAPSQPTPERIRSLGAHRTARTNVRAQPQPWRASSRRSRTSARRGGSQARPHRGVPCSATRCTAWDSTAPRDVGGCAARHPGGGRRSLPRWCRSVPPAPTEQNRHFVHFIWLVVALRAHFQKYKLQQNGYFVHLGAPRCGAACWWWSVPPGRQAALSAPAWLWAPSGAQAPGRRAEARRCWRVPGSGFRRAGLSAHARPGGALCAPSPPYPPKGGCASRAVARSAPRAGAAARLPARRLGTSAPRAG